MAIHIKLPELFEQRMKKLLGEEFKAYYSCFEKSYSVGVRVNTLKLTPERFAKICPFPIRRIPWIKKGFYYNEADQPAKHPFYFGGLYYIQEPSAMTPAEFLPVNPGDKVLDLCAAPGGKSTEIGAALCGRGVLVSNDISNSRAKALLKNIELFGIRNAVVTSEAPVKLAKEFHGFFDKILVDAPCSGEGMFRKSPSIMKNWEQYGVEYYNKLQKEILPHAVSMLKSGGYLLYSTCTFSPEEDEGTIDWLLNHYPELEIVPLLSDEMVNQIHGSIMTEVQGINDLSYWGFSFGIPKWVPSDRDELRHCIRLWPHKIDGEGHFLVLLRKKNDSSEEPEKIETFVSKDKKLIIAEAEEFLKSIKFSIDFSRIIVKESRLYLLPEGIRDIKGLRTLRSGLLLGEQKKSRFEPSQALACALHRNEYDNVYLLDSKDSDVKRYLKCESIELKQEVRDGWVLVCVDEFPLGWAKANNGILKNKYLPGWRMM